MIIVNRPFGYSCDFFTDEVYSKYIVPIVVSIDAIVICYYQVRFFAGPNYGFP